MKHILISLPDDIAANLQIIMDALEQAGVPEADRPGFLAAEILASADARAQAVSHDPYFAEEAMRVVQGPQEGLLKPTAPTLYIGYIIFNGVLREHPAFDPDAITAWLKQELPAALEEVRGYISTGAEPSEVTALIADADSPGEIEERITEHYAIIGMVFDCGYHVHQLPLVA